MPYAVFYSPLARNDLRQIFRDVLTASSDPDTAFRYVRDLTEEISYRADYPKTGFPLFYEGLFTGFYSVNFKAYKAFYRLQDRRMEIIRILPVRSDYGRILFPEEE